MIQKNCSRAVIDILFPEWQVAVQGLEMTQNSTRVQWTPEEVDLRLQEIMKEIYQKSLKAASDYGIVKSNPEWVLVALLYCSHGMWFLTRFCANSP